MATEVEVAGTTPFAHETITVADTAVGLDANTYLNAEWAAITSETARMRYRVDGTAPTSTAGHLKGAWDTIWLNNATQIANFKAIRTGGTSATLHITYFRYTPGWEILIGDPLTSITDFLSIRVIDTIAGSKKFDATFSDNNNKKDVFNQYDDVQILVNGVVIFRGRIEEMVPDFETNTIAISGRDYLSELLDRFIIETYYQKTRSEIVDDLVAQYAPSCTRTEIDTGSTELVDRVYKTTAWDGVLGCAKGDTLGNDKNFRFWVDVDKDFHYHEKEYAASGLSITLGADMVLGVEIIESGEAIINRVTVYGAISDGSQIVSMEEDVPSQTEYGLIKEHRIIDASITTTEAATAIAEAYLQEHAWKLDIINIQVYGYTNLEAGQTILLSLPQYSIGYPTPAAYLVIEKIHEYPSHVTTIKVARYIKHLEGLFADMIERILSLEKQFVDAGAVTTKVSRFYEGIGLADTFKIERWTVSDSALFGVSGHCEFGGVNWGDRRAWHDEVTG